MEEDFAPAQNPLEPDPLDQQAEELIQAIEGITEDRDRAIVTVAVSPLSGQHGILWPEWCALDVKDGEVVGFRPPETFASAEEAEASMLETACMVNKLMDELLAVTGQITTTMAELSSLLDPWSERFAQWNESDG